MRAKFWVTGAAAAMIMAIAGTAAGAAPALTGLKTTLGSASLVEKAHGYRRYHRRHYRRYVVPYVYLGSPYYWHRRYVHRRHWGDYGYFYRPWIRRYWR